MHKRLLAVHLMLLDRVHKATGAFPYTDLSEAEAEKLRRQTGAILREVSDVAVEAMTVGMTLPEATAVVAREFARPETVARIAAQFQPIIARVLDTGGEYGANRVGSVWEVEAPEVDRWIDNETTRLAEDVRDGTVTDVHDLLGDAYDAGEGIQGAIKRLREQGYDSVRAERIARTETIRAFNQGQTQAWKQSGVVKGKRWLLSPTACEFCRVAAAQFGANQPGIGLDDAFYARGTIITSESGNTMMLDYQAIDGPPLHPNCRCSLVPVY